MSLDDSENHRNGTSPAAVGAPGWYYADGDPAGTERYWDGSAWLGAPQQIDTSPAEATKGAEGTSESSACSERSSFPAVGVAVALAGLLVIAIVIGVTVLGGGSDETDGITTTARATVPEEVATGEPAATNEDGAELVEATAVPTASTLMMPADEPEPEPAAPATEPPSQPTAEPTVDASVSIAPPAPGSLPDAYGWGGPITANGIDRADGSGCTPPPPGDDLVDGLWFVEPLVERNGEFIVDLGCRFSSDRDVGTQSATAERPVVRNEVAKFFTTVLSERLIVWHGPSQRSMRGNPISQILDCGQQAPFLWLKISGGVVTEILNTAEGCSVTGDLGLSQAISSPACTGEWVVFIGSVTAPSEYRADVDHLLRRFSQSHYLRTDQSCTSLRQQLDGNAIYAVYLGPWGSKAEACSARSANGGDAYVKRLDMTTPPTNLFTCP